MIDLIKNWVINIVTLVMLIVLLEIILPNGNIKKFVNLVSGFILIIVIINPVVTVLKHGFDFKTFQYTSSNFLDKKIIEADSNILKENQMKLITKNYTSKICKQIEDITKGIEGIGEANVEILVNEDYKSAKFGEISQIYITFKMNSKNDKSIIKPIQKIDINASKSINKAEQIKEAKIKAELRNEVESKVSKFLEISKEKILISASNEKGGEKIEHN